MSRVCLRDAGLEDVAVLAALGSSTFTESYAATLPAEAIAAHCACHHVPSAWAALLAEPGTRAWLAETDGVAAGYAVVTAPDLADAHAGDLELRRIYVRQDRQGTGLGGMLLRAALDYARAAAALRLVLGVFTGNPAARAFYAHNGFHEIGARTFAVGAVVCDDLTLARTVVC